MQRKQFASTTKCVHKKKLQCQIQIHKISQNHNADVKRYEDGEKQCFMYRIGQLFVGQHREKVSCTEAGCPRLHRSSVIPGVESSCTSNIDIFIRVAKYILIDMIVQT